MMQMQRSLRSLCLVLTVQCCASAGLAQMPDLAPLPGTGRLSGPPNPGQFTFVLAGDNRPAHKTCPQPPTPGKIFSAVKQMNPAAAFVLWTGDTIAGKQPDKPKRMRKQYEEFLAIAQTAGVPVFNAPGNHEMDDGNNAPSKIMRKLYEKYMSQTYGAFTYGNSRFIAINSEHEPSKADVATSKKSKIEAPGAITNKTLKLLEQDLDANQGKAHIVIFMHHPVEPFKEKDGLDSESVKRLKKLLKNYENVSYVVSGHEHMYYNSQTGANGIENPPPPSRTDPLQPPYYLVSGGGGAPLKGDEDTPGHFFHYLVFNVNGNTISPTLIKVDSCDPCDENGKCYKAQE